MISMNFLSKNDIIKSKEYSESRIENLHKGRKTKQQMRTMLQIKRWLLLLPTPQHKRNNNILVRSVVQYQLVFLHVLLKKETRDKRIALMFDRFTPCCTSHLLPHSLRLSLSQPTFVVTEANLFSSSPCITSWSPRNSLINWRAAEHTYIYTCTQIKTKKRLEKNAVGSNWDEERIRERGNGKSNDKTWRGTNTRHWNNINTQFWKGITITSKKKANMGSRDRTYPFLHARGSPNPCNNE